MKYWSYLGDRHNTTGHLREMVEKHGNIYVNNKGGFFTQDCVKEVHAVLIQDEWPTDIVPEDKPVVYVKPFLYGNLIRDGGTKMFEGWDGNEYFQDFRIGTKTHGAIFDRYPGDSDAAKMNVRLVEINVPKQS